MNDKKKWPSVAYTLEKLWDVVRASEAVSRMWGTKDFSQEVVLTPTEKAFLRELARALEDLNNENH